jgi:hypothetical protein
MKSIYHFFNIMSLVFIWMTVGLWGYLSFKHPLITATYLITLLLAGFCAKKADEIKEHMGSK